MTDWCQVTQSTEALLDQSEEALQGQLPWHHITYQSYASLPPNNLRSESTRAMLAVYDFTGPVKSYIPGMNVLLE